jgi:LytS/YehU family sensor histidine kinase
VVQDIDENCAVCDVPPLVVQPLVENAIKHGNCDAG